MLLQLLSIATADPFGVVLDSGLPDAYVDADGTSTFVAVVALVVLVGGFLASLIWLLVARARRRLVVGASIALAKLDALNLQFRPLASVLPPIRVAYRPAVGSKRKLDNFDFLRFMNFSILESETWFEREIDTRVAATNYFDGYHFEFEALAVRSLGSSTHPRVRDDRFALLESKMFHRRK